MIEVRIDIKTLSAPIQNAKAKKEKSTLSLELYFLKFDEYA